MKPPAGKNNMQDEFPESHLIGNVIGRYQLGIGDAQIHQRVEKMISEGKLEPITQPEEGDIIYRRKLRKLE